MSYEYPIGPVSDVQKIHLLEERVGRLERSLKIAQEVADTVLSVNMGLRETAARVERLEKVLSSVEHAARLLALADNYSALETLDAATLSDVPHDLASANERGFPLAGKASGALGTHARAIEGLTALCEAQQGRIAQLERLLLTVAQALFYHKESEASAGSYADEELAGTVELLREAMTAQLRPR